MPKTKTKIITSIVVVSIALLLSITGAYALSIFNDYNHNTITTDDGELGITSDNGSTDITNIALFGVDTRGDTFTGRSDSIMIVSVDKAHNKVKITSVLRDSLVEVDGYGLTKITEAYGYGGPVLAINTLNTNFNLNIRDYATINFDGMTEVIDAVGGVTIDVAQSEIDMLNSLAAQEADQLDKAAPVKITQAGEQTLNGLQAVAYSRIRTIETSEGSYGDFGRTDRQRTVMEQLFEKAIQMSPTQYPAFIKSLLPYMETSLEINDILDLATILSRTDITFEQTKIPLEEYTINSGYSYNGKSTVYFNVDFAADALHAFIYDDIPQETYLQTHELPTVGSFEDQLGSSSATSKNATSSSTSSTSKGSTNSSTAKKSTNSGTSNNSSTAKTSSSSSTSSSPNSSSSSTTPNTSTPTP